MQHILTFQTNRANLTGAAAALAVGRAAAGAWQRTPLYADQHLTVNVTSVCVDMPAYANGSAFPSHITPPRRICTESKRSARYLVDSGNPLVFIPKAVD